MTGMGKRGARRHVRLHIARWLESCGSEPPDIGLDLAVAEAWHDEVMAIAARIRRTAPEGGDHG